MGVFQRLTAFLGLSDSQAQHEQRPPMIGQGPPHIGDFYGMQGMFSFHASINWTQYRCYLLTQDYLNMPHSGRQDMYTLTWILMDTLPIPWRVKWMGTCRVQIFPKNLNHQCSQPEDKLPSTQMNYCTDKVCFQFKVGRTSVVWLIVLSKDIPHDSDIQSVGLTEPHRNPWVGYFPNPTASPTARDVLGHRCEFSLFLSLYGWVCD